LQTQFWQNQARSQSLRFGAQNTFLGGKVCFYHMFKTIFSEHNKILGHKKDLAVTAPKCPTASAILGRTVARKSSTGSLHVCAGGIGILKIYIQFTT